ncbi:hypothetical protein D9V86_11260 [Bacteroidetes/Chlorobi group bacterium ChocPot_Mid]|nr:MAG: hypothetical protein D9V86_11260 [Bacteroidetes/Chlorobi group bacterium ChocPot_Mid]
MENKILLASKIILVAIFFIYIPSFAQQNIEKSEYLNQLKNEQSELIAQNQYEKTESGYYIVRADSIIAAAAAATDSIRTAFSNILTNQSKESTRKVDSLIRKLKVLQKKIRDLKIENFKSRYVASVLLNEVLKLSAIISDYQFQLVNKTAYCNADFVKNHIDSTYFGKYKDTVFGWFKGAGFLVDAFVKLADTPNQLDTVEAERKLKLYNFQNQFSKHFISCIDKLLSDDKSIQNWNEKFNSNYKPQLDTLISNFPDRKLIKHLEYIKEKFGVDSAYKFFPYNLYKSYPDLISIAMLQNIGKPDFKKHSETYLKNLRKFNQDTMIANYLEKRFKDKVYSSPKDTINVMLINKVVNAYPSKNLKKYVLIPYHSIAQQMIFSKDSNLRKCGFAMLKELKKVDKEVAEENPYWFNSILEIFNESILWILGILSIIVLIVFKYFWNRRINYLFNQLKNPQVFKYKKYFIENPFRISISKNSSSILRINKNKIECLNNNIFIFENQNLLKWNNKGMIKIMDGKSYDVRMQDIDNTVISICDFKYSNNLKNIFK